MDHATMFNRRRGLLAATAWAWGGTAAHAQAVAQASGPEVPPVASAPTESAAPATPSAPPSIWPGTPLSFPQDHGAHPAFRTEWWYLTGHLLTPGVGADQALGFQVTFFRSRVDTAQDNPSALAAKQLVMAHVALSDVAGRRLLHDQRIGRQGQGLVAAAEGDTRLKLRDWTLSRSGVGTQSQYQADIKARDFALQLTLRTTQPVLLQGQAGYSRKGPLPTQASRYYSQPHLAVQGRVTRQGQAVDVTGRAWLDHEWGETLLAPETMGWDWIGMNLIDGAALTAFRLRRADGSTLWAGGSFRAPGQAVRPFAPGEVRFKPGRVWVSPATGARYPVQWLVDTPVGRYEVRARLDAQELDGHSSTGSVYWEGLSALLDGQQRVVGSGYLEMTGYAGQLTL